MSSEVAIRVSNLNKVYRIYEKPEHRLIQMATLGRKRPFTEFAALHDVSLEIQRGETIGVIGRNGCGKSTLLQIICGTLQPTNGTVETVGRIAALLELGAGFNGEFTGRENVFMNAAILGLSQAEAEERFPAIAAFADIGAFIERPVKTYSSGMFVRLAFAAAISVDPDILIIDEALSVGDEAFQRKCFARIEELKENGCTILFVSHGAQTVVQLCSRAILLDGGEKLLEGAPRFVVGQYLRLLNLPSDQARVVREEIRGLNGEATEESAPPIKAAGAAEPAQPDADDALEFLDPSLQPTSAILYESHGAVIRDVRLLTQDGRPVNVIRGGRIYVFEYAVDFAADCEDVGFGMLIKTISGLELGGATTAFDRDLRTARVAAGETRRAQIAFHCPFTAGTYFMNAGVTSGRGEGFRFLHRILDAIAFRVLPSDDAIATGIVDLQAKPRVLE